VLVLVIIGGEELGLRMVQWMSTGSYGALGGRHVLVSARPVWYQVETTRKYHFLYDEPLLSRCVSCVLELDTHTSRFMYDAPRSPEMLPMSLSALSRLHTQCLQPHDLPLLLVYANNVEFRSRAIDLHLERLDLSVASFLHRTNDLLIVADFLFIDFLDVLVAIEKLLQIICDGVSHVVQEHSKPWACAYGYAIDVPAEIELPSYFSATGSNGSSASLTKYSSTCSSTFGTAVSTLLVP
jgi:hypothetical protein